MVVLTDWVSILVHTLSITPFKSRPRLGLPFTSGKLTSGGGWWYLWEGRAEGGRGSEKGSVGEEGRMEGCGEGGITNVSRLPSYMPSYGDHHTWRLNTEGYLLPADDIEGSSANGSLSSTFPSSLRSPGLSPKFICKREL